MAKRSIATALVLIFIVTTIGAVLAAVYIYQQPLESTETTTLATFSQRGQYSYVAELVPNIIYNTTILRPGDGVLWLPILSYVNITFDYSFSSDPAPTNASLTNYVQVVMSSQKWEKTLSPEDAMEWLSLDTSSLNFTAFVNSTMLYELFKMIDEETASSSTQYNVTITPYIFQRATVAGEPVYEVFRPEVKVIFRQDQGRFLDITPLGSTNQRSITDTVIIKNAQLETFRMAAIAGIAISGVALAVSLFLLLRSRPSEAPKSIEKMMSPHKDIIVDTAQVPPITKAVVETSSLDDLVRTAEVLARPIMHSVVGNEHTFFILDGETKYQYKIVA